MTAAGTGHPLPERTVMAIIDPSDVRAMISTEVAAQLAEDPEPRWVFWAHRVLTALSALSLITICCYMILAGAQ